jgi:P pilus assembly chaperone PapD
MNTKKLWVSFLAIAAVLLLVATVSAAEITGNYTVKVNDQDPYANTISVVENEKIAVEVSFTSLVDDTDVTIKAELNGQKEDISAETSVFDVEAGNRYTKVLVLRVPAGLKDRISNSLELDIKISGKDHETKLQDISLNVQRESYSVQIQSVTTGTIKAGQLAPVDIVIKNVGYNNLDDMYVTVKIPALNVEKTAYFGDLVSLEDNSDDKDSTDTVSGRLYVEIPYDAKAGTYAIEVDASNSDTTSSITQQVAISNEFSNGNIVVSGDSLLIVNPTNEVLVYRLVPEPTSDLSVSLSQSVVAIPAGSSRTVDVTASGAAAGTYNYKIDVFSLNGELLYVVNLTKTAESGSASPVIAWIIVLAIIFIVLLVVLIVLMGKKPQKSEEFGESYY